MRPEKSPESRLRAETDYRNSLLRLDDEARDLEYEMILTDLAADYKRLDTSKMKKRVCEDLKFQNSLKRVGIKNTKSFIEAI